MLLVATILPLLVWQRRAVRLDGRNASRSAGTRHRHGVRDVLVAGSGARPTRLSGLLLYRASVKRLLAGLAALFGLLERALEPIWVWTIGGKKPGVIVIGATAANVWLDSRRSTG